MTFVELGYLYLVMSRLKAELVVHSLKMKENVPKQSLEIHTNKPVDIGEKENATEEIAANSVTEMTEENGRNPVINVTSNVPIFIVASFVTKISVLNAVLNKHMISPTYNLQRQQAVNKFTLLQPR